MELNVHTEQTATQPPGIPSYTYTDYRNPTYNIVSLVGYLIGVEKQFFAPPGEQRLDVTVYEKTDQVKNARIIRNLCRIRTGFEKNYSAIRSAFRYDIKNIGSIQDLIPSDAVNHLSQDGLTIYK